MLDKIAAHYKDELSDVLGYAEMAKAATDDVQKCVLRDIAAEEHEHAAMLKHLLEREGKYNPGEDVKRMEAEADKALTNFPT